MERHPMFMDWRINNIKMAVLNQFDLQLYVGHFRRENHNELKKNH